MRALRSLQPCCGLGPLRARAPTPVSALFCPHKCKSAGRAAAAEHSSLVSIQGKPQSAFLLGRAGLDSTSVLVVDAAVVRRALAAM